MNDRLPACLQTTLISGQDSDRESIPAGDQFNRRTTSDGRNGWIKRNVTISQSYEQPTVDCTLLNSDRRASSVGEDRMAQDRRTSGNLAARQDQFH